jgi:hypothetical protein
VLTIATATTNSTTAATTTTIANTTAPPHTTTAATITFSSSTSTSACTQTTNTFPLQCLMVLIFEFCTVVLLKFQVFWDVVPHQTGIMSLKI